MDGVFCRIVAGRIPATKVHEDDELLVFHDIHPWAPVHVLVIPKGAYASWAEFSVDATDEEIAGFVRAVGRVARDLGLDEPGYRLIANAGPHSHQEVPHLHVHILAGRQLGPMLTRNA